MKTIRPRKILVVDDDAKMCESLCQVLEREGYEIQEAHRGEEGLQKIREHTSTLIFNEFPRLAKENPSNDFWAPGFMAVHGRRSMAGSLVQDFIQQTRSRQGVDK